MSNTKVLQVTAKPAEEILSEKREPSKVIALEAPVELFSGQPASSSDAVEVPANASPPPVPSEPSKSVVALELTGLEKAPSLEIDFSKKAEAPAALTSTPDVSVGVELVAPTLPDAVASPVLVESLVPIEPVVADEPVTPVENIVSMEPPSVVPVAVAIPVPDQSPTPELSVPVVTTVSDDQIADDLPYLFKQQPSPRRSMPVEVSRVIETPNIRESNDDVATLKNYLLMREQDISVLTVQLTYAKEELKKNEDENRRLVMENEDLMRQLVDFKNHLENSEREVAVVTESIKREVDVLQNELKTKNDRIKVLEEKVVHSADEYEQLKARVRQDIRKIRVREKELESKLEILKRDSETLISGREAKILELKRKIDLLEFNYDSLMDQNDVEKQNVRSVQEKLNRVMRIMKLAMGAVDTDAPVGETKETKTSNKDGEKAA